MKDIETRKAVSVLSKALSADESFYYGWQSNIAMAFYDEYRRAGNNLSHSAVMAVANQAAKNFLDLLVEKE